MHRILAGSLLCALAAFGQSNVVIDNEHVRVVKVTSDPGTRTRMHDHKMNRVMIYLQPGAQDFEFQDGKRSTIRWKAGEPLWSAAAGMHVAINKSPAPVTIMEIELKNKGTSAKAGASPLDPVRVDPKRYRVEFENDQVRVVRVKLGGKQSIPMHEHATFRVTTNLTAQDFRVTGADGKATEVKRGAGEAAWGTPSKHKEENLSAEPFEAIMVELK
ncbi:MAG: hypothetical protein JNK48_13830 [Bryobacterales bacterium]|nr:hypothetical protein [Bryobacterales bacterium]